MQLTLMANRSLPHPHAGRLRAGQIVPERQAASRLLALFSGHRTVR